MAVPRKDTAGAGLALVDAIRSQVPVEVALVPDDEAVVIRFRLPQDARELAAWLRDAGECGGTPDVCPFMDCL